MKRIYKFRAWDGESLSFYPTIWDGKVWNALEDREEKGVELMQFTGLKDKNVNCICIYEGDIVSLQGKILGNEYENRDLLEDKTNLLIEGFGTKTWRITEKKAMDRGCFYSE